MPTRTCNLPSDTNRENNIYKKNIKTVKFYASIDDQDIFMEDVICGQVNVKSIM